MKYLINLFKWINRKIKHKLSHLSWNYVKETFKKHGLALVVIFIIWELLEDVFFPVLFIWLGKNINPWFYTGAPLSWLLCLHPIAVPLIWGVWIKISGSKDQVSNLHKH
jgi:hypothetical protein